MFNRHLLQNGIYDNTTVVQQLGKHHNNNSVFESFQRQNTTTSSDVQDQLEKRNEEILTLSKAYKLLNDDFRALQTKYSLLKSKNQQLEEDKRQQILIMKHQKEAHDKNMRLMLPGEQEIDDLKKQVAQLEHERDTYYKPKIEQYEMDHHRLLAEYDDMKKSYGGLKSSLKTAEAKIVTAEKKQIETEQKHEENSKRMRWKNARLFGQLVQAKKSITDNSSNVEESSMEMEKLKSQLERTKYWSNEIKRSANLERKTLSNAVKKANRMEVSLQQEYYKSCERESLIQRLMEENSQLRFKLRIAKDQPLPQPADPNIEYLFYKNVKDQIDEIATTLELTPTDHYEALQREALEEEESEKRKLREAALAEPLLTSLHQSII
mmetsp:Transcript_4082/g.6042  ORF Transcript_4082/g.6042 Transcript_4082/m.6042 type:complete len:379 (+) Transcript_4082:49-1185(+)